MSLREVLVGMIEEYARHMGHVDLLRRRVHQRVDVIPHWREETHGSCLTSCTNRRAPFW